MANTGRLHYIINLTPIYNVNSTEISHISVKLTFGGLRGGLSGGSQLDVTKPVYYFRDMITDNDTEDIATKFDNIKAYDQLGSLTLSVEHVPGQRHALAWKADRIIVGDVTICYDAIPIGDDVPSTGTIALRRDHDGVIGTAASFIPMLDIMPVIRINVTVNWDMTQALQGTRILSSFGEGDISEKTMSLKELSECVFMVGQINSFPPPAPTEEAPMKGFRGIHSLGALPNNLSAMQEFMENMFPRLSAFFKDDDASYRVFMRKVPRGLRATPVTGGTVIDFDEDTKEEHDWDIVRLFNSSMIATWTRLDPEDDGTSNDWFTQGLSHIYTIYLPYRFGQRSPDYFRATLNGYLSSYFTNPFVSLPLDEIPLDSWCGKSALAMRSCVYMIRMDCFTRRASKARNAGVLRPIDEIAADISSRRLRGEKVQTKDWLQYLGDWMGEEAAQEHFDRMKSGDVMDLEDIKTAFDGIQPEEQRVLELGFDHASLVTGTVSGLVEQSEAAKGGLRNGDKIQWHLRLAKCEMQYEEEFRLLVEREGEKVSIEFWPRSDAVVKSWISKKKQA